MDAPSSPIPPRRWREEKPPPAAAVPVRGKARAVALAVAVLVILLAAIGVLLSWLGPVRHPYFVPLAITAYQHPLLRSVPMRERDLAGLRTGTGWTTKPSPLLDGRGLRQELDGLQSFHFRDAVVVYLSARAKVHGAGKIHILPADADPGQPTTWVPLEEILQKLQACPARNQLLVLDIVKSGSLGDLFQDLAALLPGELAAIPDPRRLVLSSCAPGQVALVSEELGRSVFSYYFEEGLRGHADGYSDGSRDNRITVHELAAFVSARVDRWAIRNRGARQTPSLHGTGNDFSLGALDPGRSRGHVAALPVQQYPARLLEAWQVRDAWWSDGTYRLAPSAFQEAQALLLEAENEWRGGGTEERLQSHFLAAFEKIQADFKRQQALFEPQPLSLAQAEQVSRKHETAAVKAVQELMDNLQQQLARAKAEDAGQVQRSLLLQFQDKMKNEPAQRVDAAIFAWALADPRHEPGTLRYLAELGARPEQPEPRFVETLLLQQLADLTYRVEARDWPAAQVGRLLHLTAQAEKAAADPAVFPWLAGLLDEAARLRHNSEICLWSRGYASLEEADKLARLADAHYRSILSYAGQIRQAQATLDEALALLPTYLPFLDNQPHQQRCWHEAVNAAQGLADILAKPPSQKPGKPSADPVEQIAEARRLAQQLALPLQELNRPFTRRHIAELEKQGAGAADHASLAANLEALLSVPAPSLKGEDRSALWNVARDLCRKLHEETVRLDRAEDEKQVLTSTPLPYHAAEVGGENAHARRRADALLALAELGGMRSPHLQPARTLLAKHAADEVPSAAWCELSELTRRLWTEPSPQAGAALQRVRLDWVAPTGAGFNNAAQADVGAGVLARVQQVREHWSWLSAQYRYQARDYQTLGLAGSGPLAAQKFYAKAAAANQAFARSTPEAYAAVHSTTPVAKLTSSQKPLDLLLEIERVLPPGAYGPLDVALSAPDSAWLEANPSAVQLPALARSDKGRQLSSRVPVQVRLRPGAEQSFLPRPLGFLATAQFAGRDFHSLVNVPLQAHSQEVEILVSTNPVRPDPALNELRLRPNQVPQPYYVYLRNHTPLVRTVKVEAALGDLPLPGGKVVAILNPEETRKLNLGAVPRPGEWLTAVHGPLSLRALDADTTLPLDQRKLRVEIASPREYVRIADLQFDPLGLLGKNRWTIELQSREGLPGPAIRAQLELPRSALSGATSGVIPGKLEGELSAGAGPPLKLFVERTRGPLSDGADGPLYLHVDGLERAFIFRTALAQVGVPLPPRLDVEPALSWKVAPFLKASPELRLPLEVDNPPPRAVLEVSLGRDSNGHFVTDLVTRFPEGKQRSIGLCPPSPDGAITLEASVRDWPIAWPTSQIVGQRLLRARLLDDKGKELALATQRITIDNDPPSLARILDVPVRAKRGSPVQLRAQGEDPESGIVKVVFFVGQPQDDKIPNMLPAIAAIPLDTSMTTWSASVPLPEDKKGPTAITAQFTNGAGLVRYHTATVELTDTDPALSAPGSLRGKVLEGPRPQPGLAVSLRDDKNNELKRTTTLPDGTFEFGNLAPGNYVLFCVKPESLRRATSPAVVEPNKTTVRNLLLSL